MVTRAIVVDSPKCEASAQLRRESLPAQSRDFEAELVEFDGEEDHVHLLVNIPPKVSVSSLVNSLKGVSSA